MRETTGIDDVEWLDAKVVELSKENERLRAALTAPDKGGPDHRAALIRISDLDWAWEGGGSKVRHRGPCGKIAAKALGIPDELPLGWPDHKSSETEAALARSVAESEKPLTVPSDLRATSAELRPCPHGMSTWQRCSQCNPD